MYRRKEIYRNFIEVLRNTKKKQSLHTNYKSKELKDHYKNLLTEIRQKYLEKDPRDLICIQGEEVKIQVKMVEKAIRSLKNGKACGTRGCMCRNVEEWNK